jgi:hypothetical protein
VRNVTAVAADTHERRSAESGWQLIGVTLSVAVLALALPVSLLFMVPDVGRSQGWPITFVIAIWAGVRLSRIWVAGNPRLFDFFFWLFTYIFFGISATAMMRSGDIPYTTPSIDPTLDVPAATITLVGVLSYEAGSFLYWLRRHKVEPAELRSVGVSPFRATLLLGVGLVVSAYFVSKLGISVIFSNRANATLAQSYIWPDSSTFAIVYALAIYPTLVAVGAFAQERRILPPGRMGRIGYPVFMLAGATALMLVANPLSSARYTAGTVAFALVLFLGATTNWRRARLTMLGTIGAFLFLFPLMNVFRYSVSDSSSRTNFFSEYQGNPDYDAFFQIANAYAFVNDGLMVPMRQIMGSLLFWVPRSLWAGKPEDTGIMLADYRGYSFTNLSAPMWAELLVNGGMVAVVIGFIGLGALVRLLDDRMSQAHEIGGWWGLVGSVLSAYTLILWRGSLLQATGSFAVMMFSLFWVRRKLPPNSEFPTVRL